MIKNMSKFVLYKSEDNDVVVDVIVDNDTLWATQKSIAQLFGKSVSTISRHIKDIFASGELDEKVVVAKNAITTQHGAMSDKTQTKNVKFYNLDMIISVGYRVNSIQATKFRQWATQTLREYMIKGFVLDDERLKQGETLLGQDYFNELLERVRSIRASERIIWQKITDIFAEISVDYDKHSPITQKFYANVQNKFHYAITGQTAAEIIYNTADHTKQNMGLTTWKHSPDGRILKSDTKVAKNYLSEKQIKQLERNVSGYFDYVEDLIERKNTFTMEQFADSIDRFLEFREYKVLQGYGHVSMKQAQDKAGKEYDIFNKNQPILSDFDKAIKEIKDNNKK